MGNTIEKVKEAAPSSYALEVSSCFGKYAVFTSKYKFTHFERRQMTYRRKRTSFYARKLQWVLVELRLEGSEGWLLVDRPW